MLEAILGAGAQKAQALLETLHPAEVADVLESLPEKDRLRLWRLTQPDKKGEVFIETGEAVRTQLMKCAKVNELVAAVRKLQPDELADILKQMPAKAVAALLRIWTASADIVWKHCRNIQTICRGFTYANDAGTALYLATESLLRTMGANPSHGSCT